MENMRANKHLEPCTENCRYNTTGKCSFGIRNIGCYLDEDVKLKAGLLLERALEVNSTEIINSIVQGEKIA